MNVKQKKLGLIIASLLGAQAAYALPQGAQVVQGSASFSSPNTSTLNITNSNNTVINWQQFNIGSGQTTNFIQPNSASSVLNRVISNNPSQILGNLNSNGQVYLINQYGILVGEGARINTNGFFASTLNITNEDFLTGNLNFSEGGFGDINNKGYIRAGEDGNVVLIAPNIENGGVIEVENGNIILAAGESITIASLDNASIEFHVQATENSITNLGSVIAKNGAVSLFAGTLKHSGSIRATGLVRDANGIIRLVALDKVEVSGSVDVSGEQAGNIKILGEVIDVQQGANINASGSIGAGEILIGGDQQGLNPKIKNATSTTVATGAKVSADGVGEADGGRVIVFASNDVHIQGDISATGGDIAGDGGFIETSGLRQLDITAVPDASATNGDAGEWLIDPNNITIQATGPDTNITNTFGAIEASDDGAILTTETIVAALNQGTNVTITTGTGGTNLEQGDININDAIAPTSSFTLGSLTLNAHNDINVNADIGPLNNFVAMGITLNADTDADGNGDINFANAILDTGSSSLTLSANAINVNGGTSFQGESSLINLNAPLTIAASGNLTLLNNGFTTTVSNTAGITNNGALTISSCDEGCQAISINGVIDNNGTIDFLLGVLRSTGTLNLNAGTAINAETPADGSLDLNGLEIAGILNNNTSIIFDVDLEFGLSNGTINNFENIQIFNNFYINGGAINFNSDIILANTVTTNIDNTDALLTLAGPASTASFTMLGETNFEASDSNFDIVLTNTHLVNGGDWIVDGFVGQLPIGAGISGTNSSFNLINDSRLVFNKGLSHAISVPVFAKGAIELVDPFSNVSFTGAGGLTLENGGRLSGIGTYTGNVIVNQGGQISPGLHGNSRDNTGALNIVGNVNFNAGSIGIWEIGESGFNFDQLNVAGNVAIDNAELFLFWDSLATTNPSFSAPIDLIQASGGITLNNATLNDLPAMAGGGVAITVGSGDWLTYTPGTVAETINYWTGLSSDLWSDGANWITEAEPIANEVLVIETATTIELSSATPSLGDIQLDANLNINVGGSLNGAGILSNLQEINLLTSTSNVTGAGVWNNLLAVNAINNITLSRTTINNYGSFTWSNPNTTGASFNFVGDDFNNVGMVNFNPLDNGNTIDFSGSANGLINAGLTLFNIGAASTDFIGNLNNTILGIVSVVSPTQSATLNLASDNTNNGEIFLNDTVLSLNSGVIFNLASSSNLTGTGNYLISTGSTLQVNNMTFGSGLSVDLSGGTLEIEALSTLAINDAFNWISGTLEGNNTGVLTTGSFATTLLGSNLDTTMNNVNWNNNGHVAWISSQGDFVINNSIFTNSIQAVNTFSVETTSNLAGITGINGVFNNEGSFEINNATTATNTIIDVEFNHSAAQSTFGLDLGVAGHTLALEGNSHFSGSAYTNIVTGATLSITNGATLKLNSANIEFEGLDGRLSIASGSTLDVSLAPLSFNVTLDLNSGTINNAQNLTLSGMFNWNGGTITGASGGSFTADGSSTVNLNATSNLTLNAVNMTTTGTTTFSSSLSDFILNNNAVWTNTGILNLANTSQLADIQSANTTITTAQLINTGTINASPSIDIDIFTQFDNQGTVNITSGIFDINSPSTLSGTIDIDSGTFFLVGSGASLTLAGTPAITGNGTFGVNNGGTFDSAVALTLPQTLTTQLNIGGTISNAQNLILSGILNWNGGTITGASGSSFTADATSTVNITASLGNAILDTVNMVTNNNVNYSAVTNSFILGNNANWTNAGTLNMTTNAGITATNSTTASLVNSGTLNYSDLGLMNITTDFVSSGALNINLGNVALASTSTLSGDTTIALGSVLSFTGDAATNINILSGASFNGLGVLSSTANVTVADGVNMTPRLIVDGGIVSFEGSSTLTALDLNIGTINVDTLEGASVGDTLTVANLNWTAGTISGDGSANLVTTGLSSLVDGSLENIVWTNNGILNWGGLSTASLTLNNASLINAVSGTLNIIDTDNVVAQQSLAQQGFGNKSIVANNSLFENEGTINLINSTLDLNGQTLVLDTSTAVLNGTGIIVGDVINSDGTISMGSAVTAGSIVIDGDYTQGVNGTLVVRIVDPINGDFQFDTFAVNGLATLGGTLELVYFSNQVVSITENFNPFTFTDRNGVFDTLVDSNDNILDVDISNGGFTILGASSQTTSPAIQEVLQNLDRFEEIFNILNDEELDETLAFISEIIRAQNKQKNNNKESEEKKWPKLVCI